MSNRQAGVEATVAALQQTVSAIEARAHQADEANRASDASLREAVRIIDSKVTQLLLQDRASAARR